MNRKGFSLIEMAMVLIIIGLIMGTIFPLIVSQIKKEKLSTGREVVDTARDEIIGYAITHFNNGYTCLPPTTNSTYKPQEIAHTRDPWGRDLKYYPALNATGTGSNCFNVCKYSSDFHITPVSLSGRITASDLAFVVASGGDDHRFQLVDSDYPGSGKIDVPEENADLIDYVTLSYLASKVSCSSSGGGGGSGGPPGSDISFENNLNGFSLIISTDPNTISVDESTKTVSLGNNEEDSFGCIWYGEGGGPCSDGICTLGKGFRAYFEFKTLNNDCSDSDTTDYASGFTFAITSDVDSPSESVCGGIGAHLGYAGTQPDHNYWIGEPKMAVEFDFYPSNTFCNNGLTPYCFNKNDGNKNHVAIVYWGNAYYIDGGRTGKDICTDNCRSFNNHNGDDNRHGAGSHGIYDSLNPSRSSSGYKETSSKCWLEDGEYHKVRIELTRDPATHTYTIKVWIDRDNSDDLTSPFNETPDLSATTTISKEMDQKMDKIRFGWTEGTADLTQDIEIKNFGIKFLGD